MCLLPQCLCSGPPAGTGSPRLKQFVGSSLSPHYFTKLRMSVLLPRSVPIADLGIFKNLYAFLNVLIS